MYYAGHVLEVFDGARNGDPSLEVVTFKPSDLRFQNGNPNLDAHDHPGYSGQAALSFAQDVGSVIRRAVLQDAVARGANPRGIPPLEHEELAKRIAAQDGTYLLARSAEVTDGQIRAYARVNSPTVRKIGANTGKNVLRVHALEAPNLLIGQYGCRRAASAILATLTKGVDPNTRVIVDAHQEIAETRSEEYFREIGLSPGNGAPPWGNKDAYFFGRAGEIREAVVALYDLQPNSVSST